MLTGESDGGYLPLHGGEPLQVPPAGPSVSDEYLHSRSRRDDLVINISIYYFYIYVHRSCCAFGTVLQPVRGLLVFNFVCITYYCVGPIWPCLPPPNAWL